MRDITSRRFGRLVAESLHHSSNHKRFWSCSCDCGNHVVIRQDQLTTGKTKSCGCYNDEVRRRKKKDKKPRRYVSRKINGHNANYNPLKHEQPRLYSIWQSMKSRCYYEKNKCYGSYGGRGICICDEWRYSFNSFALWALSNGYRDDLTIDRINVNGNYEPANCRWATNEEQQKNKRKSPSRIA